MSLFHPRSRAEQFEAMAAEYERPIYLLCLRMMGNREDAQDCAPGGAAARVPRL